MNDRKNIRDINEKIEAGKAIAYTEIELWQQLKEGANPYSIDLDLLITAFGSSIRGSAAMLLIPVAERGIFTRARKIWLNGVEGFPGPAPNERLGVVDTMIFADQRVDGESATLPAGARLLMDILHGDEIQVECTSEEGDLFYGQFRMRDLDFATMVTYNTFLPERLSVLLSSIPGGSSRVAAAGTKILLNGAPGIVIGCGSRSRPGHESLSLSASMFDMNSGSIINDESDVTISVAMLIPVGNKDIKLDLCNLLQRNVDFLSGIKPLEIDAALYLKRLVTEEYFRMTESWLD